MDHGVLAYDIFKSSLIKSMYPKYKPVKEIFEEFHESIWEVIKRFNGKQFSTQGDSKIFYFDNLDDAIHVGIYLLGEKIIEKFNEKYLKIINLPMYIRLAINITKEKLDSVPENKRGTYKSEDLDVLGHLVGLSSPMRLTLTENAFKEISSILKPLFMPGTKFQKYKSSPPILTYVNKTRMIKPLFNKWDYIKPELSLKDIKDIISSPLLVIFGETNRDHPILEAASISDDIWVTDLLASLNRIDNIIASIDEWDTTLNEIFNRNILLIGSGIVNKYSLEFNDIIDFVKFVRIGDKVIGEIRTFDGQSFGRGMHGRHYGLVACFKNPYNIDYYALWIAGITGLATNVAASFVKDIIINNIDHIFKDKAKDWDKKLNDYPVACVLEAAAPGDLDPDELYRRWKVTDYKIKWMVDPEGNVYYQ